ncbi:MAG: sulfite exporter TauE/SafE family protein [Candidatus Binataceae bacterium]|jgi:uncharacterized membrane protein YfcA
MARVVIALIIGLISGVLGGIFGVGGGVLIVPALVLLWHTPQHTAVGTSLGALLPPVGILGAMEYYRRGQIDIWASLIIGLGLLVGAYFGAAFAGRLSDLTMRRAFAVFLAIIAARLFFK